MRHLRRHDARRRGRRERRRLMAKPEWPPAEKRSLIGKRISRLDGSAKTTGAAKYSYDINRPGLLYAKPVWSPYARAEVVSVDTAAASALPGVKFVWKDDALIGKEVNYAGQIVAAVAAETEEIATEAAHRVKVEYKPLEHQVRDDDPALSQGNPDKREDGTVDDALAKAEVVVNGRYGIPVIAHCCLEPHGQVTEIRDGELYVWPSTQNVSGYADRSLAEATEIPQNKIHVDCQYMGGGFGSKFSVDKWGTICATLTKQTGRPVKFMLDRDLELMTAGNRPSAHAAIKVGATKDGTLTAIDAEIWGTSGMGGTIPRDFPYVFNKIPNNRRVVKRIQANRGSARAWRAPNHPQLCFLTMSALADMAAEVKMDELEFFLKNLQFVDPKNIGGRAQEVYKEELLVAADLIGYKQKAHPRGDKSSGPIKRGLGMALHTWGGLGHDSECDVTINPDGSVEAKIGTQDLGTGARTVVGIVIAETLGLPLETVKVQIGKNQFPKSGGSGGSSTVGGISTSSRMAATAALNALCEAVAQRLNTAADNLEASAGFIRQTDKPSNRIAWKEACATLGVMPITKHGANARNEGKAKGFTNEGVGGVQMADVSVDVETGVVTINEMVAVQDCGLIIDLKTAESQVYGALIMGITYALFEEAVYA